ncbi:MAG TPA: AraC family transcriptional regulator [Defluviitaleaceae bacterium]|jgi:effector-binding domain-containing protein|nr:AraC family transcriptional regulator [Defluviitaleaceae bacterium]
MINIEVNKGINFSNLLSLRKKITQEQFNNEMVKISGIFESNQVKKSGPIITTTFMVETINGENYFDMEILVPMDRKVDLPSDYNFKQLFKIVNAVYVRHEGNPAFLQKVYDEMLLYITKNSLQQITPAYNVTVKDLLPGMSADELVIDVYIGVSENIL